MFQDQGNAGADVNLLCSDSSKCRSDKRIVGLPIVIRQFSFTWSGIQKTDRDMGVLGEPDKLETPLFTALANSAG